MNSVIEKLAEVEETAEAIVEHARQQKSEIEKQIQEERNQFDRDLEEETQKKLEKIKAKSQQEVEKVLDRERKKNQTAIDDLKQGIRRKSRHLCRGNRKTYDRGVVYGKCDGLQWDYDKGTCNVGKAFGSGGL